MVYKVVVRMSIVLCLINVNISFAQESIQKVDSVLDVVEKDWAEEFQLDLKRKKYMLNAEIIYDQGSQIINIKKSDSDLYQLPINESISFFDVKNLPLDDVLDDLSDKVGIIFITPESIPYKVSMFVEDMNVWDLLKILLQQYNLAYYRTNGAVHIMSADVFQQRYGYDFPIPFPTKMVVVKYADLENLITELEVEKSKEGRVWVDIKNRQIMMIDSYENLQKLQRIIQQRDVLVVEREFLLKNIVYSQIENDLKSLLTESVGKIEVLDGKGSRIVVKDTAQQLMYIEKFLFEKDKQVVVSFLAKIFRIKLNEEHMRGVDWEAIVSEYQTYKLKSENGQNTAMTEQISFGVVTTEDYDVLIEALDTVGQLTQLIVFDIDLGLNQEEVIRLETNDPFWSLRPGAKEIQEEPAVLDQNGFEMRMNLVVSKESDGFIINVLPRLHWMNKAGKDPVFIGLKEAEVKIQEGEVVVIGGLTRTEEVAKTRKVPLLGNIPMFGSVFRRERKKFENTEYIIFLELNINSGSQE